MQHDAAMKRNLDFTKNVQNKYHFPPALGCKVHSCDAEITSRRFFPSSEKTKSRMCFDLQQRKDDELKRRAHKSLTGCPPLCLIKQQQ